MRSFLIGFFRVFFLVGAIISISNGSDADGYGKALAIFMAMTQIATALYLLPDEPNTK